MATLNGRIQQTSCCMIAAQLDVGKHIAPEYRLRFPGVICLNCAMALNGHSPVGRAHRVQAGRHEANLLRNTVGLANGDAE